MRASRNARFVTLSALIGAVALAAVLVTLLKTSAHQRSLPSSAVYGIVLLSGMLAVGLLGLRAWASSGSKVRPLCGLGLLYVVSPLTGMFAVLQRMLSARAAPAGWQWLATSTESGDVLGLVALVVCFVGMLLVVLDLARMIRHRAANEEETWQAKEGLPRLSSFRLLTGLAPELGVFDSVEQAMEVQKGAFAHIRNGQVAMGGMWLALILCGGLAVVPASMRVWTIILCGLLPVAVGISWPWLRRKAFRHYVWAEAWRAGFPLCAVCGYDLRGLESARCPECGDVIDRSLGEEVSK